MLKQNTVLNCKKYQVRKVSSMDNIYSLAKGLNELFEIAYKEIAPRVEKIITSQNKDINLIESYLVRLLDIPTDEAYILLQRLCNYCENINPEIAEFYINEYEEIYDIKEDKAKKRTYPE